MGRPSKFTPERQDRFLAAIAASAFREVAARRAGWSPATLYRILRSSAPEAVAFRARLAEVETELEVRLGATITQAAFGDARLALSLLERRFGERWSRRPTPPPLEELPGATGTEAVVLDQATVELLVPKLLEARTASGQTIEHVQRFAQRRPRATGEVP